jgi:hypothetical protein
VHVIVLPVKRTKYRLYIDIYNGVNEIQKCLDVIQDCTDTCQVLDSNSNEGSELENFYVELKYIFFAYGYRSKLLCFREILTKSDKSFIVYFSFKFYTHNQYLCLHITSLQSIKLFVISYLLFFPIVCTF